MTQKLYGYLRAALLGITVIGLAGCAAPKEEASLPSVTDAQGQFRLGSFLKALRQSPDMRPTGTALCVVALDQDTGNTTFHPFLASFFNVPLEDVSNAFCEALTEALFSNALSDADLAAIDAPDYADNYEAVGKLLRQLLIANDNAGTQLTDYAPNSR
jgi:hypothetical protein